MNNQMTSTTNNNPQLTADPLYVEVLINDRTINRQDVGASGQVNSDIILQVTIPQGSAVNEILLIRIQSPNGSHVIEHTLVSADFNQDHLFFNIPNAGLQDQANNYIDGDYQLILAKANNIGAFVEFPTRGSFTLDTTAPDPVVTAEIINGADDILDFDEFQQPIVIQIGVPASAQVGDELLIDLNKNGLNIITYTITAADIGSLIDISVQPNLFVINNGTIDASVSLRDSAGNFSQSVDAISDVDNVVPQQIAQITLAKDDVNVARDLQSGDQTDDLTPQLHGTIDAVLAAGEQLNVLRDGIVVGQATVTASAAGAVWFYDESNLIDGVIYSYQVQVIDLASNKGPLSNTFVIDVDTTLARVDVTVDILNNFDSVVEGHDINVGVTLSSASDTQTRYAFSLTGTADSSDYGDISFTHGVVLDAATQEVVVPANIANFTILIPTLNDDIKESLETLTVEVGNARATASIIDRIEGDTDGDGVIDSIDLDDDNDGILDVDEGFSSQPRTTDVLEVDTKEAWQALGVEVKGAGVTSYGAYTNTGFTFNYYNQNSTDDSQVVVNLFKDDKRNEVSIDLVVRSDWSGYGGGISKGIFQLVDSDGNVVGETRWQQADAGSSSLDVNNEIVTVTGSGNGLTLVIKDDNSARDGSWGDDWSVKSMTLTTVGNVHRDTDNDGIADYLDLDSDNDGITDNVEAQTTEGYQGPTGGDANGDGVFDVYAAGLTAVDTDSDGVADYIDQDSDNDGINDIVERDVLGANSIPLITSNGSVEIKLTAGSATASGFGSSIHGTLNDTFEYNPDAPTSPAPVNAYNRTNNFFHGKGAGDEDAVLEYFLQGGFIQDAVDTNFVVDLYGRNTSQQRDDDLDIEVFDKNGVSLGVISGLAIDDDSHLRVNLSTELNLAVGTEIASLKIIGHNSAGDTSNLFTLMEIRAAKLPAVSDTDGDGLLDIFEDGTANDGYNVFDSNLEIDAAGNVIRYNLADTDDDLSADGSDANGLVRNLDYREDSSIDTDNDGVLNIVDLDDDNDGILDVDEGFSSQPIVNTVQVDTAAAWNALDITSEGAGVTATATGLTFNAVSQKASSASAVTINLASDEKSHDVSIDIVVRSHYGTNYGGLAKGIFQLVDSDGKVVGETQWQQKSTIGNGTFNANNEVITLSGSGKGLTLVIKDDASVTGNTYGDDWGVQSMTITTESANERDSDNDGIADHLDLDSDNDGITDNVEAQSTQGYKGPSGVIASNGVDTAYTGGLSAVDTDADGVADYIDSDSDDDGELDVFERGGNGPDSITSDEDTDRDGLLDIFEGADREDGYNVSDENVTLDGAGEVVSFNLRDTDGDAGIDGKAATGQGRNFDYRENPDVDPDDDGIANIDDLDDDNDGILDTDEGFNAQNPDPVITQLDINTATTWNALDIVTKGTGATTSGTGIVFNAVSAQASSDASVTVKLSTKQQYEEVSIDIVVRSHYGNNYGGAAKGIFQLVDSDGKVVSEIQWQQKDSIGNGSFNANNETISISGSGKGLTLVVKDNGSEQGNTYGDDWGVQSLSVTTAVSAHRDTDSDGIADYLDLDSDNDGITDNVEAQSTQGYQGPTGVDLNQDGVDDIYVGGLTAVDTDSDGVADYIDQDSDNDGISDIVERDVQGANSITSTEDTDGDGLLDIFEDGSVDDGYNVFDSNVEVDTAGNVIRYNLADTDDDLSADGSDANGLVRNLDYREDSSIDTDNDGVLNIVDLDDDNDGILDVDEGFSSQPIVNTVQVDTAAAWNALDITSEGAGVTATATGLTFNAVSQKASSASAVTINLASDEKSHDVSIDIVVRSHYGTNYGGLAKGIFQLVDSDGKVVGETQWQQKSTIGNGTFNANNEVITLSGSGKGLTLVIKDDASVTGNTYGDDWGVQSMTITTESANERDSDNDGVADHLDLDSDNDGITDNVEAQTTQGYKGPSGVIASNGVDTAYTGGLSAVDTDADGVADYIDSDSDDDGELDVFERGGNGPDSITSDEDTDRDGLLDIFEGADREDGYNVSDENVTLDGAGEVVSFNLRDTDGDAGIDGKAATGQGRNFDYRENPDVDPDDDGIANIDDLDDDNDGILDTDEGFNAQNPDPVITQLDINTATTWNALDIVTKGTGATTSGTGIVFNAVSAQASSDASVTVKLSTKQQYEEVSIDIVVRSHYGNNYGGAAKGIFQLVDSDGKVVSEIQWQQKDSIGNGSFNANNETISISGSGKGLTLVVKDNGSEQGNTYGDDWGVQSLSVTTAVSAHRDTDSDGIADYLDLDSDNDGITDNVEAQASQDYKGPSGFIASNGVDTAYTGGLKAVDTDADGIADYIDSDSDNDGALDVSERGGSGPDSVTSNEDSDGDGLLDIFEGTNNDDGYNVSDENVTLDGAGEVLSFNLRDTDGDAGIDGKKATGQGRDFDYRENPAVDPDNDGIANKDDLDDDNDGILDIDEGFNTQPVTVDVLEVGTKADWQALGVEVQGPGVTSYGGYTPTGFSFNYSGQKTTDDSQVSISLSDDDKHNEVSIDLVVRSDWTNYGGGISKGVFQLVDSAGNVVGETKWQQTDVGSGYTDANNEVITVTGSGKGLTLVIKDDNSARDGSWGDDWSVKSMTLTTIGNVHRDTDNDGIADYLDLDSDNDGITDNVEAQTTEGYQGPTGMDLNQDGVDDVYAGGLTAVDTDGDGIVDYLDQDSDNDGVKDIVERDQAGIRTITSTEDTDGDGLLDIFEDGTVNDGYNVFDSNVEIDAGGNLVRFNISDSNDNLAQDGSNASGTALNLDYREDINIDTDGDGILNVNDIDDDNDGILDINELTSANGSNAVDDLDGDGIINSLDLDSDNDGIGDNIEAQSTRSYVAPQDVGITDVDRDGLNDAYDQDTTSQNVTESEGLKAVDSDGDQSPDFLDNDSDSDDLTDREESGLTSQIENSYTYQDTNGLLDNPFDQLKRDNILKEEADYRVDTNVAGVDIVSTDNTVSSRIHQSTTYGVCQGRITNQYSNTSKTNGTKLLDAPDITLRDPDSEVITRIELIGLNQNVAVSNVGDTTVFNSLQEYLDAVKTMTITAVAGSNLSDVVTIKVTVKEEGIALSKVYESEFNINTNTTYTSSSYSYESPLILDLDHDGVETLSIENGVNFDINADGNIDRTGWVGKDDGLLVMDINGDGIINDGSELFGENTLLENGETAEDGFRALSELDSNKDSVFDANDQAYDQVKIWKDTNSDGVSQAHELYSLIDLNVESINLNSVAVSEYNEDNWVGLRSSWSDSNGQSHDIDDVWFATDVQVLDVGDVLDSDDSLVSADDVTASQTDVTAGLVQQTTVASDQINVIAETNEVETLLNQQLIID